MRYSKLSVILCLFAFSSVASADVDGNNLADLFRVRDDGLVTWYESDEDGTTINYIKNLSVPNTTDIIAADIDGDGRIDVLIGTSDASVQWYKATGQPEELVYQGSFGPDGVAQNGMAVADFFGDGYMDLIVVGTNGLVYWYQATPDNSIAYKRVITGSMDPVHAVGLGDFDGDGKIDMFLGRQSKIDRYKWDSGSENWIGQYWNLDNVRAVKVADFGNPYRMNGKSDLLIVDKDGVIRWYTAGSGAGLTPMGTFGTDVSAMDVYDVFADGSNEIVAASGYDTIFYQVDGENEVTQMKSMSHTQHALGVGALGFTRTNIELPAVVYRRTIMESENRLNFPRFSVSENYSLAFKYSEGSHTVDEVFNVLRSDDMGWTWSQMDSITVDPYGSGLLPSQMGTGPVVSGPFATWKRSSDTMGSILLFAWDDFRIGSRQRVDITFPFEPDTFHWHGDIIVVEDGTVLAPGYGRRNGSDKSEIFLIASEDWGKSWTYRGTPVSFESELMHPDVQPSEPALIQLNNGDLLVVARCGDLDPPVPLPAEDVPMFYSISSDHGYTWSTPVSLGTPGVSPRLEKLDDGTIALSYGRPNVYLRFADKTATQWGDPMLIYEGCGSGYTGLRKTPDGDLIVAYAKSDWGGGAWACEYPGDINYLELARIAVTPHTGGYLEADLNFDGKVDFEDFAIMAQYWLEYE